MTEITFSMFI